jgi:hypothetical protein
MSAPESSGLRVTVNFHPDRQWFGNTILGWLVDDGVYRSQFDQASSVGSLSAARGTSRWHDDRRVVDGVYDESDLVDRPKTAAVNHRNRPYGGAPRFGSAHLRLKPAVLERTTFCLPNLSFETDVGLDDLAALIERAGRLGTDLLDDYVEAHVRGRIAVADDVEALVLDPAYRDTDLADLARKLPCPVEWHAGFLLKVDQLAALNNYRGPDTVAVARAIAQNGQLDPRILGQVALLGQHDPELLEYVWHLIARFGYQS